MDIPYMNDHLSRIFAKDRTSYAESLWDIKGEDVLDMDDVRIVPNRVVFEDAYEGKHFEQGITIQNCGKNTAFVRVGQPSSFALELSPILPRGEYVPAGLLLKRKLKYVFSESTPIHYATITYYVNNKEIHQKVKVKMLSSRLSCDRYFVDFGEIDIGPTPTSQSFTLTNDGSKSAKFVVDMGHNDMKLIVNPVKGKIEAHSSIVFSIEAVRITAGKFDTEIWIKSYKPIRIRVIGEAKLGNLEICNKDMILGSSFSVFDFPKTYYGAKSVIRIILKNNSASRGVFCTLAKIQTALVQIEEAEKVNSAYKNFQLSPPEGRIGPKEAVIITVTFHPDIKTKLPHISNEDDHRSVLYHIKKLSFCKDIYVSDYPGGLFSVLTNVENLNNIVDKNGMLPFPEVEQITTIQNRYQTVSDQKLLQNAMENSCNMETNLNICLHADVEQPNIITTPNEIIILNMRMNESQTRTIQFKNLSTHLPIFLSYKKLPFIEIRPKFLGLKPLQSAKVAVIITPAKIGKVTCHIDMELLFYNQPRQDFEGYVSVGQISIEVKFTTPGVTTRRNEVTPNVCRSFPKRISNEEFVKSNPVINRRQDTGFENYELNKAISILLTKPKSYSVMAMEKKRKAIEDKQQFKLPEYEVNTKGDCCRGKVKSAIPPVRSNLFLNGICPLTPNQMNNISIEPRILNIGRVAAYSKITKSFKVINKNDIPISISIVPVKQRFFFPDGDNKRIEPQQITDIPFNFFSEFEGLHSLCVRVVVNQNHIYDMTIQAQVVPRALTLETDRINLGHNGQLFGYINVKNTLNIPLAFNWDLSNSSCIVFPQKGSVAAGKDMICTLEVNEKKSIPTLQDIGLVTEKIVKCRAYVAVNNPVIKMELSANCIKFGHVPLNQMVSKCLVLKNNSNIALDFKIPNPAPVDGLKVVPKLGRIPSKGIVVFKVILQAKHSLAIDVNINIIFNQTDYLQFQVTGQVLLPKVVIKPATIQFQKIPTSSYDTKEFYVYNKGNVPSTIRFPSKKLQEWKVLRKLTDNDALTDDLEIEPKTNIKLYIQYAPMNITNHWFYLPLILNDCIGHVDELFTLPSRLRLKDMTRAHNCVPNFKLFNVAYEPTFELSKYRCNFTYYPYNPEKCYLSDQVSLLNVSTAPIKFCLRTDEVGSMYKLVVTSNHEHTLEGEHSIIFVLKPDNEICFTASYHPEKAGKSSCRIPIYVQNDYRTGMHNFIIFSGYYQEPLMETERKVYFGMLPLNVHVQKQVAIKKLYHNTIECKVTYEVLDSSNVIVDLQANTKEFEYTYISEDTLVIKYSNCKPDCSLGRILLTCTCGCRNEIEVIGCMENSMLTSYGYLHFIVDSGNLTISKCSSVVAEDEIFSIAVMEEVSPFPYFPNKLFENQKIFQEAITAIEDWIFDFGSFGLARHLLPDTLRYVNPPTDQESDDNKDYVPDVIFLELLDILGGDKVMDGFCIRCPVDPNARAMCLQCLYANILGFLRTRGGNAPHISPEFLLDYEEYCIYKRQVQEADEIYSIVDFNSISKQSWLDLLLQTIKVFIMVRIKERPISDNLVKTVKGKILLKRYRVSMASIGNFYRKTKIVNQNYFSSEECLLLKWLEYHYFINILRLCPSFEHVSRRKFENFNSAIMDSIALATVIVRYCPYLIEDLDNLYWKPTLSEENFHNAAKVLQTLTKVNNSFTIKPQQICVGNDIKKLLFVAYLYEFLPTLEPLETIECKAPLSQSVEVRVTIKNDSDTPVEYKAILFGDVMNVFQLQKHLYVVEAHKTAKVEVMYMAKFAKLVSCTLLLSGEMNKKRMATSICYKLHGIPDVSYMTSSFTKTIELYSLSYFTIEVKSPYNNIGTFEIFSTIEEPTDVTSLNIESLFAKMDAYQGGKLSSFVSNLSFDSNGMATWTLLAMACTMISKGTYFYLHNDIIGDFALKIEVNAFLCSRYEELQVNLPIDIHKKHCICTNIPNVNCLRYLKIKIPGTNLLLQTFFYDAYYEMCCTTHKNVDLYNSPNGRRIINHLFKLNKHESADLIMLHDIMTKPANFDVKLLGETSENIRAPKSFRIEHVDTLGTSNLLLHINGKVNESIRLHLTSQDSDEIRLYKLNFGQKTQYKKIDNI